MKKYLNLVLLFLLHSCLSYSQQVTGAWTTDLNFGSQKLKFVVHIEHTNKKWTASADSPDQGAYNIPFDITVQSDSVFLDNPHGISLRLKYTDEDKLQGHFTQNSFNLPVVLSRTQKNSEKSEVVKFQTPKPPYSYDTLNIKIPNTYDKIQLA